MKSSAAPATALHSAGAENFRGKILIQVGNPLVANAKIQATVVEHDRSKKILVFKKKRKKQYRRTQGHRQDYTAVRIDNIIV